MGVAVVLFAVVWFGTSIPQPNQLATAQSTIIYFADGKHEIGRIGALNRVDVPLRTVPKHVRDAVLAAEDRRFYSEPGISVTGIARALWVDVRGGDVTQGGSTITQQYAKNYYLTQNRTVTRKLREIVIALKLDEQLSKDRILQNYLNTIYFGRGAYGIASASRAYFGKDVSKLTPAEGAVLAAVIRAPSYYDPGVADNRDRAESRWRYVLDGMVRFGDVTQSQADSMAFPKVKPLSTQHKGGPNGFLVQMVHDELLKHGFTDDQINLGGLRVVTTIDRHAQQAAITAENKLFTSIVKDKGKNPPVSSLAAVRPGDGGIVALYGGRNYGAGGCANGISCFNLATQAMAQPGSSFKPYTLATAIEQGIGIKSRMDGPPTWTDPQGNVVRNDSGESCHNCDLVTALAKSINTIFVPLADKVGPRHIAETAHAAGIPDNVPLQDPNGYVTDRVTLGVFPVHPIDQAVGIATFAARGEQADPYIVAKVLNVRGKTLYRAHAHTNQAFSTGVADDVSYAMQHVVSEGTATAAQLDGGRPAAGKTGTTQNNTNAWFIGYTAPGPGQISAAVWVGHAKSVAPLTDVSGYTGGVYGGTLPARIWKAFMDAAMQGKPVEQFPPPKYVGAAVNAHPSRSSTPSPTTSSPTPTTSTPAPTTTPPPTTTTPPPTTTTPPPTTTQPPPPTTTGAAPPAPPTTSGAGGG
jgi:membrane peptidoglycan carboxypeptidase